MALAKIDVAGMADVVTGVEQGADRLEAARSVLSGRLARHDLDTSRTHTLGSAAQWARDTLPGLRRRLSLAQALEGSNPAWPAGTVELDETLLVSLSPSEAAKRGRELAVELRDHPGVPADDVLAELLELQHDPYFATAFAQELSPEELSQIVRALSYNRAQDPNLTQAERDERDAWYAPMIAALSETIATATRATGSLALPDDYAAGWVAAITEDVPTTPLYVEGDGQLDQANALGLLLSQGRFGTSFLDEVATGVYDYERTELESRGLVVWRSRTSPGGGSPEVRVIDAEGRVVGDPLAGIMAALGHNPEAAQHFFSGGPRRTVTVDGESFEVSERLAYLLRDREWDDDATDGGALGSALEAATTTWRDTSGRGAVSAEVAGQSILLLGDRTGEGASGGFLGIGESAGWQVPAGMRPHVAQILASYASDLYRVGLSGDDDLGQGLHGSGSGPLLPSATAWGVRLRKEDVEALLGTLGQDEGNVELVLAGVLQASQLALDDGLTLAGRQQGENLMSLIGSGAPIDGVTSAIQNSSDVVGWVLRTGYDGDVADKELQARRAAAVADALNLASSLPFVPEIKDKWLKLGVDQAKDAALDGIRESIDDDPAAAYDKLDEAAKTALVDDTMDMLLRHGLWSPEQLAQRHEWEPVVTPPPSEAIAYDAAGNPVGFRHDSPAYAEWVRSSGIAAALEQQVLAPIIEVWAGPR